jgi:ribonuclease HII
MPSLLAFYQTEVPEAGIDEAGRGCYAGPVCAAAVILPIAFHHPLLNDSKQLKEADRYALRPFIEEQALAWAVAMIDVKTIDRINILQATYRAMHQAVSKLTLQPGLLLVDGNRFRPMRCVPHRCMVKGDATYASIAAASILAKTYRDDLMVQLHEAYPHYRWNENKGYGTEAHRKAIAEYGLTQHHRRSFRIGGEQIELF